MLLCVDEVRVMEGSLGELMKNKCLYFPKSLCQCWVLGTWSAKGCLHRLGVEVIGHRDGL